MSHKKCTQSCNVQHQISVFSVSFSKSDSFCVACGKFSVVGMERTET